MEADLLHAFVECAGIAVVAIGGVTDLGVYVIRIAGKNVFV
jgi:hypothetical protein